MRCCLDDAARSRAVEEEEEEDLAGSKSGVASFATGAGGTRRSVRPRGSDSEDFDRLEGRIALPSRVSADSGMCADSMQIASSGIARKKFVKCIAIYVQ